MKKFILSSAITLLMMPIICMAKIWRVNNTPGITADFTTAQAAHNGAAAGDTLHFEPSADSYGSLILDKKLILVSLGFFLGDNPGLQYSTISSRLDAVTVNIGGAGSILMINTNMLSLTQTNNITLLRCRISAGNSISLNNADNVLVLNCFVGSNINFNSGSTGVVVRGNIIGGAIGMGATDEAVIANNVIGALNASTNVLSNSLLQNNIFNKSASSVINIVSCILNNNLSAGTQLPAGNLNNVDMATVFVNPNGLVDNSFILKQGGTNPAQGAGVGGIDCGAFAGSNPFVLGMIPPIPSIYKIQAPVTPTGNSLNVIISTRSNN